MVDSGKILDLFEHLFNSPPVYNAIFSCLAPPDLYRAATTCRLLYAAVAHFHDLAYNINRHLARFLDDPLGFRKLQAKLGFLVSGSNVLQFLDRTHYPNSDLDLFAYPEHVKEIGEHLVKFERYEFVSREGQSADFAKEAVGKRDQGGFHNTQRHLLDLDDGYTDLTGMSELFCFRRPSDSVEVQIISVKISPLDCILYFHSTCVLNFFTHITAYSLYPAMTFDKRVSIAFGNEGDEKTAKAFAKYSSRGWTFPKDLRSEVVKKMEGILIYDQPRHVGDQHTWRVQLDTQGLDLDRSSPFNSSSSNPLHFNSLTLKWDFYGEQTEFEITYTIYQSSFLEETYLVEGKRFRDALRAFEEHIRKNLKASVAKGGKEYKLDKLLPSLLESHAAGSVCKPLN